MDSAASGAGSRPTTPNIMMLPPINAFERDALRAEAGRAERRFRRVEGTFRDIEGWYPFPSTRVL
jgi:hypothetical protein